MSDAVQEVTINESDDSFDIDVRVSRVEAEHQRDAAGGTDYTCGTCSGTCVTCGTNCV